MKQNKTYIDDNGYKRYYDTKRLVHRSVAYHYIYDPNEYQFCFGDYVIHHIDHNKLNNHSNNLMILTSEEHSKIHGFESDINPESFVSTIIRNILNWLNK